jgi:outer membrane protein
MKHLSTILSIIAIIIAGVVGFNQFRGNGKSAKKARVISAGDTAALSSSGLSIAYVDLDTLEENYTLFKKKKEEFEAMDKNLGTELERMQTQLQNEYMEIQKKAQAGSIPQDQLEMLSKKLQQRQQEIEVKKQNEGSQLIKKQEEFNKKLQDDIRGFLDEYAEDKGYDFVMAYTKTSTILFANPELDVTQDVIVALNSGKSFGKKDNKKTADSATKK